jgi:FkbM family methyltransferase
LDWIDSFEKDCIFFDVGASFGTETLYAALKKDGPQKIVSFDLDLESSFNLAYNIKLNNISNVEHYLFALSDGFKFNSYRCVTQYYCIEGRRQYDNVDYKTIAISMDKFIEITNIFPDYIKIDVDGAEERIIAGMEHAIKNDKLRSVVIEVSDKSEPVICNFFHKAGFRIELERTFETEEIGCKNIIFKRN